MSISKMPSSSTGAPLHATDHGRWLSEILDHIADPPAGDDGVELAELIAGVSDLVVAGVPCQGFSYQLTDYVLQRFCRDGTWWRSVPGAPNGARELFGLYVRHGYVKLGEPVSESILRVSEAGTPCPLEYAMTRGPRGLATVKALLEEGADVDAMLQRLELDAVHQHPSLRTDDANEMVAVITEHVVKQQLVASRGGSDAPAAAHGRRRATL